MTWAPVRATWASLVPTEELIWQDPIPKVEHKLVSGDDIAKLKSDILASGVSVSDLVRTAWASASTFRSSDYRGGANGGRLRLAPQKDWAANDPASLGGVLTALEGVQSAFNSSKQDGTQVSMADLIVLGGAAAIEQAAQQAGHSITVPFVPGRADATKNKPISSFVPFVPKQMGSETTLMRTATFLLLRMLVDKSDLLSLTVPEMTALVGGMRALNANSGGSQHGIFTKRPGQLSNDFFVNLLDNSTVWVQSSQEEGLYEGQDRDSKSVKWTATPVDLIFGSNSELRAIAEVYASSDGEAKRSMISLRLGQRS